MKAKAKVDYSKMDQREYAFGMLKGAKKSEDWLQMKATKHLRENYPDIRFYSTLDGFNLGNQRSLISSIQSIHYPGIADLFVFYPSGRYSMLILELKKDGERILKADGRTYVSDHVAKQADWLHYFKTVVKADAKFSVGLDQTLSYIDQYLNPKTNGKEKTSR